MGQVIDYIETRIKDFEEKLQIISEQRAKELAKPFVKRNYLGLFILHKDETLYNFCLSEFLILKDMTI